MFRSEDVDFYLRGFAIGSFKLNCGSFNEGFTYEGGWIQILMDLGERTVGMRIIRSELTNFPLPSSLKTTRAFCVCYNICELRFPSSEPRSVEQISVR